jgi:1,5-rhamnosyltransferase
MKYNYIFIGDGHDWDRYPFLGIDKLKGFAAYTLLMDRHSWILRKLYWIHMSTRLNKWISLPFKNIWNSLYFNKGFPFEQRNPLCFVFMGRDLYYLKDRKTFNYLRTTYEGCKLVIFFGDTVETFQQDHLDFDIRYLLNNFDFFITTNKPDAQKYSIGYFPTIINRTIVENDNAKSESDVLFIGASKNRLDKIHQIYNQLQNLGLKCEFHITNVPTEQQKYLDIVYNKPIPYSEVLKFVQKTKCILEITQKNAYGFTLRTVEALLYNKKLLSDNPILKETPFYDEHFVMYFSNVEEIGSAVYKTIKNEEPVEFNYNDEYSLEKFIQYIDSSI